VTACFNWLSGLWNEIEAAEDKLEGPEATLRQYHAIKEKEKATRFLLTLNDSYAVFRSQVLAMDPQPPLGRIFQLAVQEENQRTAATDHARVGEGTGFAPFPSGFVSTETLAGTGGESRGRGGGFAAMASRNDQRVFRSSGMDGWDRGVRFDGRGRSAGSNGWDSRAPSDGWDSRAPSDG